MTTVRTALLAATTLALTSSVAASLAPTSYADPAAPTSRTAARTVLDVSDLEQGAPPAIAWSERRSGRTVIHGTAGTTTPVSNRLDQFAPMGSGHVVQTTGTGAFVVNVASSEVLRMPSEFADSTRKWYVAPGVRPVNVWLCDVTSDVSSVVVLP